ncbi:GAF and ANTAR domain-containing protein [Blastococcus sp. KM273129]|uniref:GAF and ANTAR domain-containing protein n=1 Tax=Blastococcus sp. KM273129 TaxID=2570315 RepID=UPI001F1781CA|nr:GAF and ANTAR domain-containing protein [Blastococcus sp. KM273129]MCF6734648.1 GAF and ANTAR domain-containing protein [Blastococcus sp. KM273129]
MTTSREEHPPGRGQPSSQGTGTAAGEGELARRLADAARDLQERSGPQEVMDEIVALAVRMVPGAEESSISMTRKAHVYSAAATGDLPRSFDRLQGETGQGPCVDALLRERTVRVDDLAGDARWPYLAARATDLGVRSLLCFQLFVHGDNLGALNLMSGRGAAFGDESEHVGLLLASHAAVAVADAQELEHVSAALVHRDVIGQAKGILMERFKITADQAFGLLAKVSQDSNRKLHAVAEELTRTGTLRP